jgi:hypothetical protein
MRGENKVDIVRECASLQSNYKMKSLANTYGLDIVSVSYEDNSRTKGSIWGPCISDMTLYSQSRNMSCIRKPNYTDKSVDLAIDGFQVTVGNECGGELKRISLKEYLENLPKYTGNTNMGDMLKPRDSHLLCSSQACVLPVHEGEVEFNVRLYNYQSRTNDPAVLTIVSTSQGTSCQVIESGTTDLYFNNNGKGFTFLAKRLTQDRKERGVALEGEMTQEEKERNVIFIFQVPLKQKPVSARSTSYFMTNNNNKKKSKSSIKYNNYEEGAFGGQSGGSFYDDSESDEDMYEGCTLECATAYTNSYATKSSYMMDAKKYESESEESEGDEGFGGLYGSSPIYEKKSVNKQMYTQTGGNMVEKSQLKGLENAVLRAGTEKGSYTGTKNYVLERDDRYPIRCTLQYYKVTDSGDISDSQMKELSVQLNRIYNSVDDSAKGSLVVNETNRVTETTKTTEVAYKAFPGQPLLGCM